MEIAGDLMNMAYQNATHPDILKMERYGELGGGCNVALRVPRCDLCDVPIDGKHYVEADEKFCCACFEMLVTDDFDHYLGDYVKWAVG